MVKQGAKSMMPRLRFPEFRQDDPWAVRPLGSDATFDKGRGVSKADVDPNGHHQCIRYGELYTRYGEVIREVVSKTSAAAPTLFFSRINDVIVPASGETKEDIATASCVLLDGVALGGDLNVIRSPHNGVFLSYLLNGSKRRELAKVAQGDTVVHLYPRQLAALSVAFPGSVEQQRIADCLTSLDEVIAAQGRKVEALKAHKRGLMQQLFPREGEARPRLRFPEFRNAPDWRVQRLNGFIEEFRQQSNIQDEYEVLTSARSGLIRQRDYYDNDRITERDNIGFNVIPPGYLTYRSRSDDRTFYFNENNLGITGIISIYYPVFRVRGGSNGFFINLLARYADVVGKHSVGTSQTVLSLNELRKVKLPVPLQDEQQRIAECLASLDTRINAETVRLAALKTHKQGLMQQLFPAPEATGA